MLDALPNKFSVCWSWNNNPLRGSICAPNSPDQFPLRQKGLHMFFTCTILLNRGFSESLRPNMEMRRSLNLVKHVFHTVVCEIFLLIHCCSGTLEDGAHTHQLVSSQLLSSLKHRPKVYCEKDNKNEDQYYRRRKKHSNTLFSSSTIRTETLLKALVHGPFVLLLHFFFIWP